MTIFAIYFMQVAHSIYKGISFLLPQNDIYKFYEQYDDKKSTHRVGNGKGGQAADAICHSGNHCADSGITL